MDAAWITALCNVGALGVLAWYFLRVQPKMLADKDEVQMKNVASVVGMHLTSVVASEKRDERLSAKIEALADAVREICHYNRGDHEAGAAAKRGRRDVPGCEGGS